MILGNEELHSRCWLALKEYYEQRLLSLRAQNDRSMPTEEAEKLRGRIAEVKEFLKLGDPPVTIKPVNSEPV